MVTMSKILNIAHRGAKAYFPENTLLSFRESAKMKADGIELDVHLSADGQIVVMHDHSIDRTSSGSGLVAEMNWETLQNFRIGAGEKIPSLSEVFDLFGPEMLINVELKEKTATKAVVALIEAYVSEKSRPYSQFLVSAFDWTALKEIRKINPEIPLGVLTETDLELAIAFSKTIQAETIHPYFHLLNAENVAQMQNLGFRVFAWTVNEPEDILRLKSYQVNGIITDFPDRL